MLCILQSGPVEVRHTVTVSIAPIICVLDDEADPLQLFAAPLTFVFWLPCWLYALVLRLSWQIPRLLAGIRTYLASWLGDLRLMAAAVSEGWQAWVGFAWAVGTG